MNKNLILSSLLISSSFLLYVGCANKEYPIIYSDKEESITEEIMESRDRTIVTNEPIDKSPYIPNIKYYKIKSVQGESITVGEHSRGFEFPQYKGKIVLLQFFGKECHYCFEEMPIINRIKDRYSDILSVIAIQSGSPMVEGEAQRLIQEHNMNYPIVDKEEAIKLLVYLRDIYEWRGILPYLLLIKDGQIEQVFKGEDGTFENISQGIKDILND